MGVVAPTDTKPEPTGNNTLITEDVGVWRVLIAKNTLSWSSVVALRWNDIAETLARLRRLFTEIFRLGPGLFALIVLEMLWSGVKDSIFLQLSGRVLKMIEEGTQTGYYDSTGIYQAIGAHIACTIFSTFINWLLGGIRPVMKTRSRLFYQEYLLKVNLNIDIPTSQDNASKTEISSEDPYDAFEGLSECFTQLVSTLLQLYMIVQSAESSNGGLLFAFLCLAKQIIQSKTLRVLWYEAYVVYSKDLNFLRMKSLEALVDKTYRQDILSGDLVNYIIEEYKKARAALGNISDESAEMQYYRRPLPFIDMLTEATGDFPMIYYASQAIRKPTFSLASIAKLQQSSTLLRWSMYDLKHQFDSTRRNLDCIKRLYSSETVANKIHDGFFPYPAPADGDDDQGMSFEFQDVSFTYPGSKSTTSALKNLSLSIPSNHLIVVVGANGSGKSTLVKLLTRLYDPTSGSILLNNRPIASYQVADLRKATALLTQDHNLFPLSLAENIGLGHVGCLGDTEMIKEAAKLGGAYEFIGKLEKGLETVLKPVHTTYQRNANKEEHPALMEEYEKLEKSAEVSGGEKQRLVASRTFMRFQSGKIKLVVVDEPSSALDPEGEFQLFERLREHRAGKTMLFVTHRFGHITTHADLILCMKDGMLVESGKHTELMGMDGEYAKLYRIQAKAFTTE